jgi:hypothetical protein
MRQSSRTACSEMLAENATTSQQPTVNVRNRKANFNSTGWKKEKDGAPTTTILKKYFQLLLPHYSHVA